MYFKKSIRIIAICIVIAVMFSACGASKKELAVSGENSYPAPNGKTSKITVMTYNVKNCEYGKSISAIASDIKEHNPAVVCVQEIDNETMRSGKKDILKLLAQELKMNYSFFPAINLQRGLYGIGIMSIYPLENCQIQPLKTRKGDEARVLASADIKMQNKTLHLFNTHLSYEDKETRLEQIEWLSGILKNSEPFILTGDFNIESFDEYGAFSGFHAVNTEKNPFESYIGEPETKDFFRAIDNIFVSNDLKLSNKIFAQTSVSDHRPLVAEIDF